MALKVLLHAFRALGLCNVIFRTLAASIQNIIKPEIRMQSENAITIVDVMASMCIMYKLYVCYLEHRRWTYVEV